MTKISSDHEIFITKIYSNANLERITKFLNHENLELYGTVYTLWSSNSKLTKLFRSHVPTNTFNKYYNASERIHNNNFG